MLQFCVAYLKMIPHHFQELLLSTKENSHKKEKHDMHLSLLPNVMRSLIATNDSKLQCTKIRASMPINSKSNIGLLILKSEKSFSLHGFQLLL